MYVCVCPLSLTSEAIRYVGLEDNVAEHSGEREGIVALVPQRDVSVASLQAVQRQDPLTNKLIIVIIHSDPQHSQVRQDDLCSDR